MGILMTSIRPMTVADVPRVVAMETAWQPRPWSKRMILDELAQDNRVYLVAEDDEIVGFGGVFVAGDEAHVTNLLVAPKRRQNGVGRQLMVSLMNASIDLGARHLTLEVRSKNKQARRLYQRLGLAPVGVRPGYYGDDDALIMWAHDIDSSLAADLEFAAGEASETSHEETLI